MLSSEPEALLYVLSLSTLQLFPGLPVQHFWTETMERYARVSSCQKLGTHPDTGAGKQCKNINKGMTGVKHKWGTSFFCPTNTSNRLYGLKIPSESLSSFLSTGKQVFNYLKQMFIILPCANMNFLLTVLKVIGLQPLQLNCLKFVQQSSYVLIHQHFASLQKC